MTSARPTRRRQQSQSTATTVKWRCELVSFSISPFEALPSFPCRPWPGALFGVLGFDKGLQAGQVRAPEYTILLQPGIHCTQGFWIELVKAMSSLPAFPDQMRPAQQPQVLGDRRPRHRKGPRDLSRGLASLPQEIEHGPAGGIGERVEGGFRFLNVLRHGGICNRTVTHNA